MGVFADALAAAMNPSCAGGNHAAIYLERQVHRIGSASCSGSRRLDGPAGQRRLDGDADRACGRPARQERRRRPRRRAARRAARRLRSTCRRKRTAARARRSSCSASAARHPDVPTDADFRMDVAALAAALDETGGGVRPFAVVATAGTTNTGAIDVSPPSPTSAPHDVWLHVDAAYGGPAILPSDYAARSRDRARGQRRARSAQVALRAGRGRARPRSRRRRHARDVQPGAALLCGPTATPRASAVRPGSASTGSSRRAASGR